MATSSPAATPNRPSASRSRTDRDRLRDYYGLSSPSSPASTPKPSAIATTAPTEVHTATQTIPQLLKSQSDLVTQIRELDGERQSLVYNHHTDLVEASETIAKLKKHADSLDSTLATLSATFQSMSKLESQIQSSLNAFIDDGTDSGSSGSGPKDKDILTQIVPVVTLPRQLRDVIALGRADPEPSGAGHEAQRAAKYSADGLAAAEALWGRHEAILSDWSREGIAGAEAIASECRAILREERERSGALNKINSTPAATSLKQTGGPTLQA